MNLILPDGGSRVIMLRGYESADSFSNVMPSGFAENGTNYRLGTMQGGDNIMRLEYNFSGTNNNGNVLSQKTSVAGGNDHTQTFTYDGLNRLASVNEAGGYAQTYGYDQWSNRWVSSSTGLYNADPKEPTSGTQFSELNNQFSGATYDAAGNQLTYNGYTYEYDADGRNTVVKIGAVTQIANVYDGLGRRVKKVESGETTYYVYDAFDRLAVEYTTETLTASTTYPFTDMLGSVRAITSSAGALLECYDYTPFGRMLTASDTGRSAAGCYPSAPAVSGDNIDSGMSQKFTGQPHDDGTGLDYFGARFYSASLGRFTSPDPVLLTSRRMAQPHTLNLYVYANNNPLRFIDPTGLDPIYIDSTQYPVNQSLGRPDIMDLINGGMTPWEAMDLMMAIPSVNPWDYVNYEWLNYNNNFVVEWVPAGTTQTPTGGKTPQTPVPEGIVEITHEPIYIKTPSVSATGDLFFEIGAGSSAMARNYNRMKEVNWIGSDKYYHCMGNCEATNYGPGGAIAAKALSYIRTNIFSRYFFEQNDWQGDYKANICGQNGGNCTLLCAPFIPQPSPGNQPFPGW